MHNAAPDSGTDPKINVQELNENFSYQWNEYGTLHGHNREEFYSFLALPPEADFKDELVLDAGCGSGRFTIYPAQLGARRVIGMDASGAVRKAAQTASPYSNVSILQGDIAQPPFLSRLDTIISIGVVHHMEDPFNGIVRLTEVLKPGGRLFLWVYAKEGNEVYKRFIEPIRRNATTRLPVKWVNFLSYGFAVAQWILLKTFYVSRLGPSLPMYEYFQYLRRFDFNTIRINILDKLSPKYCYLFSESDLQQLMQRIGLKVELMKHRNKNSWTVHARKPPLLG